MINLEISCLPIRTVGNDGAAVAAEQADAAARLADNWRKRRLLFSMIQLFVLMEVYHGRDPVPAGCRLLAEEGVWKNRVVRTSFARGS